MTDRWLVGILACPVCRGHPLALEGVKGEGEMIRAGQLRCPECGRSYRIEDGLASLLPDELDRVLTPRDGGWQKWRELMDQFLAWRERTWGTPEAAEKRRGTREPLHRAFVEFCGLEEASGDALDIGCGAGHVRELLSPDCRYVGVDPLPGGHDPKLRSLPAHMPRPAEPPRIVQAVGEALPFCAASFDVVLVMGSLDHCRDAERLVAEARRVLRPGGMIGVLQGVGRSAGACGLGRSILRRAASVGSRGIGARRAAATHLRSFTSESLRELVGRWFEVRDAKIVEGRAFMKAVKAEEGEGTA